MTTDGSRDHAREHLGEDLPAGALLLAGALTGTDSSTALQLRGAARTSRISAGTFVVHADLHNHSLLSDGAGAPEDAFESMRAAGLDVAALTDHATLAPGVRPPSGYGAPAGLTSDRWTRAGSAADDADDPGSFSALRGFEWTEPRLGHMNIWYSTDFREVPSLDHVAPLYDWLREHEPAALACFNHPGREPGRFERFRFDPALRERFVGLEMFNRQDDYLFEGYSDDVPAPLVACLAAGWRPGLLGVSDEHTGRWGRGAGSGRSGLWVSELSRQGVYDALRARRVFATRVPGLRLDATADGVRMGAELAMARHRAPSAVRFRVDVDAGPEWSGRPLQLQLLRPGPRVPEVIEAVDIEVGPVHEFSVPLSMADGGWVVLRVADSTRSSGYGEAGPVGHPGNAFGIAYASPWWLTVGDQE
jgi:hypothetical protein